MLRAMEGFEVSGSVSKADLIELIERISTENVHVAVYENTGKDGKVFRGVRIGASHPKKVASETTVVEEKPAF